MAHDHAHHDHKADARAAFTGLIGGAIALLAMVVTIVHFTNKKFAAHEAAPTHEQSTPSTGAPPATPTQPQSKTPH